MRSKIKNAWKYIGCSAHKAPSLSNVVMRSAAGTKVGAPSVITCVTKVMMDCLVAPSFLDGKGSWSTAGTSAMATNSKPVTRRMNENDGEKAIINMVICRRLFMDFLHNENRCAAFRYHKRCHVARRCGNFRSRSHGREMNRRASRV